MAESTVPSFNPYIQAIISEERKKRAKISMAKPRSVLHDPFLTDPSTNAPSATATPLVGGYKQKYLKYKEKYLALKINNY
jgi:hypothetical protein